MSGSIFEGNLFGDFLLFILVAYFKSYESEVWGLLYKELLLVLGFSFYSYPTALTYEYHIPISDPWNTRGKQYLRILFDFN